MTVLRIRMDDFKVLRITKRNANKDSLKKINFKLKSLTTMKVRQTKKTKQKQNK